MLDLLVQTTPLYTVHGGFSWGDGLMVKGFGLGLPESLAILHWGFHQAVNDSRADTSVQLLSAPQQ